MLKFFDRWIVLSNQTEFMSCESKVCGSIVDMCPPLSGQLSWLDTGEFHLLMVTMISDQLHYRKNPKYYETYKKNFVVSYPLGSFDGSGVSLSNL